MNRGIPVFARGPHRTSRGHGRPTSTTRSSPWRTRLITKRSVGPFVGTELDRVLRVRDINTIASMGVATNYVVESAVREGVDRGLKAVVLADCCASATEQTHDSVRVILPDLCSVMTADDFIDLLAGSGSKEPRQTS
jgi:nicotinamidase-related amidase